MDCSHRSNWFVSNLSKVGRGVRGVGKATESEEVDRRLGWGRERVRERGR